MSLVTIICCTGCQAGMSLSLLCTWHICVVCLYVLCVYVCVCMCCVYMCVFVCVVCVFGDCVGLTFADPSVSEVGTYVVFVVLNHYSIAYCVWLRQQSAAYGIGLRWFGEIPT